MDEFTGRTLPGRRWGDGLHQAIEAKEGLDIQNETTTEASISYQVSLRSQFKIFLLRHEALDIKKAALEASMLTLKHERHLAIQPWQ